MAYKKSQPNALNADCLGPQAILQHTPADSYLLWSLMRAFAPVKLLCIDRGDSSPLDQIPTWLLLASCFFEFIDKDMSGVLQKFLVASMIMWMAPIAVLYGFNYHIFPGSSQLSTSNQTLISGFLAVISVNLVITWYIVMAMKEPAAGEPQPDPAFLAEAKASISHPATASSSDDAQAREKEE